VAQEVSFGDGGAAKIRNLWICLLLLVVTLGVYYLYWYFAVNYELRDYGGKRDKRLHVSPGLSLLAITVGALLLLVPPLVSVYRTVGRVRIAEELGGIQLHERINHALGFTLFVVGFVLFPVEVFYLQRHLNRLWRHELDEQTKAGHGMRGPAPAESP
jgi:Domain of unknown function (DUF4234)